MEFKRYAFGEERPSLSPDRCAVCGGPCRWDPKRKAWVCARPDKCKKKGGKR